MLPAEDLTDYFYSFTQSCNSHTVHVSILISWKHFFKLQSADLRIPKTFNILMHAINGK